MLAREHNSLDVHDGPKYLKNASNTIREKHSLISTRQTPRVVLASLDLEKSNKGREQENVGVVKDTEGRGTDPAAIVSLNEINEFCEAETFTAACPDGHVIAMTHAYYGRMRMGKCVDRDYGYVGCYANVMTHMDALCSGQSSCSLRIPDGMLDRVNECPKDFKTYLEASYKCIPVSRIDCNQCRQSNHTLISSTSGFLSPPPDVANEGSGLQVSECGTQRCAWRVRVAPGQLVNLTLLDFSLEGRSEDSVEACYNYAIVSEDASAAETPICGGLSRKRHVYTSVSNQVDIELIRGRIRGQIPKFLVRFEVIGCADFKAPPNSHLKREGDTVVISCFSSGRSYHLRCEDSEWIGSVGDCPKGMLSTNTVAPVDQPQHSTGLMVAIVIGIALVIGSFILTLGLILIKRRRNRQRQSVAEAAYHSSLHATKIYDQHYGSPSDVIGTRPCFQTVVHGKGNDYDYTMELRPLPTVPAYTADVQGKPLCPQTHCQCFSPYDSFQYGTSDSPRITVRTAAPPHYFTLDPKRQQQQQQQQQQHEATCMLVQQPDVTQTPLIATAQVNNEENSDKEMQCVLHRASEDDLRNDSGTCSWP
ncbi:hypothetical protein CAPTEDRAFT_224991 [Capitella teleta]|uniref:SUEL-type lectin domain-containing protein n=1 Tax=Capitella teleta TaxID=283909 RepID=R7V0X0_CAPTE|nr:hypothetical protein CAPTEDRAFT_224991 [Capitella teleta]|eukprot:ELU12142.1 hypothetical protein CAPTEDRAFT_224991 [Capitella teleta]